jgi:hypothetical protein
MNRPAGAGGFSAGAFVRWLPALCLLGCSDPPPPQTPQAQSCPPGAVCQPAAAQPGAPAQPGVQPGIPGQPLPAQPGPVTGDPISNRDLNFLRQSGQQILNELVGALPAAKQQRVFGIPLVVDDTPGEVNAFAACSSTGRSAMAITDGLLLIGASLSEAQAHDELFGTRKVDEYVQLVAANLQPGQPVPLPPPGFFPGATDPRVVARQHQIFEEVVAFVLGHELGHHHLGHLPCTAGADPLGAGEAARILSNQVALFNQPNEIAADLAGTNNVLDAGRNRAAQGFYNWTENGGLLTMRFFAAFGQFNILTSFERSHPPAQLRTPIIQQAANTWRATGGAPFPIPGFGGF